MPPSPALILLVWVTLSPSQFAALMNVIWLCCVSILFVSYLLCVVSQHPQIDLYTVTPPTHTHTHLQTRLWYAQLFSWLLLITASCPSLIFALLHLHPFKCHFWLFYTPKCLIFVIFCHMHISSNNLLSLFLEYFQLKLYLCCDATDLTLYFDIKWLI